VTKIDHFDFHYNQNCKSFTWVTSAGSILKNSTSFTLVSVGQNTSNISLYGSPVGPGGFEQNPKHTFANVAS